MAKKKSLLSRVQKRISKKTKEAESKFNSLAKFYTGGFDFSKHDLSKKALTAKKKKK